jgi:hypothetical protein
MRITRYLRGLLLGAGVLTAPQHPGVIIRLFASSIKAALCGPRDSWPPLRIGKALSILATAAGFVTSFPSVSVAQQFRDVTREAGLILEAKHSWGNPIWGDINNDGFLDLIVPTHGLLRSHGPFVYLNNAGSTFTDIRRTSGITKHANLQARDWHGFSFGDFDADGNLDLYISIGAHQGTLLKSDLLFRGLGDGTFENVTHSSGIEISTNRGRCGFWVDYDNDGKLDLFVKNFEGVNRLYKNNGKGTFTQVADAAGLADAVRGTDEGFFCSFADYDNDGFMDVAFSGCCTVEALYRNQGDGTFVDVTAAAGLSPREPCQGIAWGDYDNDGFLDLYVARGNRGGGPFENTLYRNNGDGTFTNVTAKAGVAGGPNNWAALWGDYDNDGFLDLFIANPGINAEGIGNANFLYHNNGDRTFTNRATEEGLALQDDNPVHLHKVAAWGDYNNDGFLDIIVKDGLGAESAGDVGAAGFHRLFKNMGNSNHFIKVNLTGVQSNLHGIGARVTVTSNAGMSFRQNNGGGGGEWGSQGSEPLHFGIGTATEAEVEVIWPSGVVDILPSVAADSTITVVEGMLP